MDIKQHWTATCYRAWELCESWGGCPGLPVPTKPCGFCGRKVTLNWTSANRVQELCESWGGHPGLPVPKKPHGYCGCKATVKQWLATEFRSCVKIEVAILGSPSLISLVDSVDVKQQWNSDLLQYLQLPLVLLQQLLLALVEGLDVAVVLLLLPLCLLLQLLGIGRHLLLQALLLRLLKVCQDAACAWQSVTPHGSAV